MHPLLRRQLRKAFPGGVPDSPELAALAAAVADAYAAAEADRAQLERSLELATAELVERNHAMTLILDHVAQGFVSVGLDGAPAGQGSRALTTWFGPIGPDTRIWRYLFGHVPELEAWLELGFDSLRQDLMPPEVVLAQLPRNLERAERQYRVDYEPIGAPPRALLVVVSDVTAEVARQRAERAQAEVITILERAARDRAGFATFVREIDQLIDGAARPGAEPAELRRCVHTLKGNFGLFGLHGLAALCHQLETALAEDAAVAVAPAVAVIAGGWDAVRARVDGFLGLSGPRTLVVDWAEYQEVLAAVSDTDAPWVAQLRRWGQDPVRPHLARLAEQGRQLAERLGKGPIDVDVVDAGAHVDRDRFAPLWAALVHAVRNAVDHGLEAPDDRVAAGKPETGRLALRSACAADALLVEVADDGAGIDWEAVAARAVAHGLPAGTAHERAAALAADGVSTAAAVTEISGRGVGVGAIAAVCARLGGRLEVDSAPGHGTTIRCVVPLAVPAAAAAVV